MRSAMKKRSMNRSKRAYKYNADQYIAKESMSSLYEGIIALNSQEIAAIVNKFLTNGLEESITQYLKGEAQKYLTIIPTGSPSVTLLTVLKTPDFKWDEIALMLAIVLKMGESLKFVRKNLNPDGVEKFEDLCKKYNVAPTYEKRANMSHLIKFSRFQLAFSFLYPIILKSVSSPMPIAGFPTWHKTSIMLMTPNTLTDAASMIILHEILQQEYIRKRTFSGTKPSRETLEDSILGSRPYLIMSLFHWSGSQIASLTKGSPTSFEVKKQRPQEVHDLVAQALGDRIYLYDGDLPEKDELLSWGARQVMVTDGMEDKFQKARTISNEEFVGDLV